MYYVWHATEGNPKASSRQVLVNDEGQICWLVDPGINGRLTRRDDGTRSAESINPPQAATVCSDYQGNSQPETALDIGVLGVIIAVVVELCGVSSLAFAVGMYLPLSSSAPIFVGGVVRYVVERWGRKQATGRPRNWNRR